MKKTDSIRFSQMISVLEVMFDKELTQAAKDAYWIALEDLPITTVEAAGKRAIRGCKFFPKPSELRGLVEGSPEDAALEAWHRFQQAFRKAGSWTSVLFEDGAIAEAVTRVFGGWLQACDALHAVFVSHDQLSPAERKAMLAERRNPDDTERLIRIGGLSPEMLRAKQKEFLQAYRQSVQEGFDRVPQYLRGYCETQNLQGSIVRGEPIEVGGRLILMQGVYVQGKTGRIVEAEFDFYSGQLLTPVGELIARPALKLLPPKQEQKLLTGTIEEVVDPEEAKQVFTDAIADLAGLMRMPPAREAMTDEQWEARRQFLKDQVKEAAA